MTTPNNALACDYGLVPCGAGCAWHLAVRDSVGERAVILSKLADNDRRMRVAKRSPQAPSLALHAADYGIAPVARWGQCDRAVATNRLARTILALCYRQRSTPLYGDTVWTQAREIVATKARRARIAALVASRA